MLRFLTIALLAGAAIPAAAIAQDHGRRTERSADADSGPRPERAARADRPAVQRAERAPRVDRQQRNFAPAAAVAGPQAVAQSQSRPDRGWRGNRGGSGDGQRQRGWRNDAPAAAVAAQPQPVAQARGRDQRREWSRDNNRNAQAQRNWDRNNDGRRDWNRNDNRSDWNRNDNRRFDNNRGWDGNRNARNWNRSWRNDRRYDWQRYRNANRYAYRLSRYYAPSGWHYGYRRFDIGATLFAGLFAQNYWIGDPYSYRLPPVEWPYQWVRYYDDALLVDTETGEVVDVISGIFW